MGTSSSSSKAPAEAKAAPPFQFNGLFGYVTCKRSVSLGLSHTRAIACAVAERRYAEAQRFLCSYSWDAVSPSPAAPLQDADDPEWIDPPDLSSLPMTMDSLPRFHPVPPSTEEDGATAAAAASDWKSLPADVQALCRRSARIGTLLFHEDGAFVQATVLPRPIQDSKLRSSPPPPSAPQRTVRRWGVWVLRAEEKEFGKAAFGPTGRYAVQLMTTQVTVGNGPIDSPMHVVRPRWWVPRVLLLDVQRLALSPFDVNALGSMWWAVQPFPPATVRAVVREGDLRRASELTAMLEFQPKTGHTATATASSADHTKADPRRSQLHDIKVRAQQRAAERARRLAPLTARIGTAARRVLPPLSTPSSEEDNAAARVLILSAAAPQFVPTYRAVWPDRRFARDERGLWPLAQQTAFQYLMSMAWVWRWS
jgi:hypothetical protein